MSISQAEIEDFVHDPVEYFDWHYDRIAMLPRDVTDEMQLKGLRVRFKQLRDKIPYLKKLADKQGIHEIDKLEDIVPLLFEHTVYKSYPATLLARKRFDQITTWLGKLTATDLSQVDMSGCNSIDEFMERLYDQSDLYICHSSGTTGTFSLIPWSKEEVALSSKHYALYFQQLGDPRPENPLPDVHIVWPSYNGGGLSHMQLAQKLCDALAGGDRSHLHVAFDQKFSSDISYLAGRIALAKAKGDLDKLEVDPELLNRLREFELGAEDRGRRMAEFIVSKAQELKGKRVFISGTFAYLHPAALNGLKQGLEHMFAPDSVLISGDGRKGGSAPPEGWQDDLKRFIGVSRMENCYAMSEISGGQRRCTHGHHHFLPWMIPFLLDPDTSQVLPRVGVQTGRMAFFDLLPHSHWGGFISGDEVTVHWDETCSCGQPSAWLEDNIDRYSVKRGGDDKISCSAASDAHADAMQYLAEQSPELT